MSRTVDGDVERIVLAPGIERVNTTVRITESGKRRITRSVLHISLWGLLLVIAPALLFVAVHTQGEEKVISSAIVFVCAFTAWAFIVYMFFAKKGYLAQQEVLEYNTVSFPTEYFEPVVKRTVHGVRYDLAFSEQGESNIPENIKELISSHNVSEKVASFTQQEGEHVVFTYDSWHDSLRLKPGRTFDAKTKTPLLSHHGCLPEHDLYVATINNKLLPHNREHYFLPDNLLTTSELFNREK